MAFKTDGNEGRQLVPAPVTDSVWARFYEIGTDRPIFGDRDKTIHDKVEEISFERRNGYGWYGGGGNRVLEHYRAWSKIHPGR